MNRHLTIAALALLSGIGLVGSASAALIDRGGGLLYDTVLNITWLQDASYAMTSGYDADGAMQWWDAHAWAVNLVYHDSVRNVDYSDWRLAANKPIGADWNYNLSFNGSTDDAFNITSSASELSYMYYVNLGLVGYVSPTGDSQPNWGVGGDGFAAYGGVADVGLVRNLWEWGYWSGTVAASNSCGWLWEIYETPGGVGDGCVWKYDFSGGYQGILPKHELRYAWAVRDGDVTGAVPEPASLALLGLGLAGLGFARRRKQKAA